MTDEPMKRFCDRRLSRRIDEQLHHVISKIVTGRSVYRPVFAQGFRPGENFFCQHVDRPSVARQSGPERFRGTLLKFDEIFAR